MATDKLTPDPDTDTTSLETQTEMTSTAADHCGEAGLHKMRLQSWKETIEYERGMFDRAYAELEGYRDQEDRKGADRGAYNAWVECFVLHFRNLVEFFYSEKDWRPVRCRDFLTKEGGDQWREAHPDLSKDKDKPPQERWIFDCKHKAHVYLAHPSKNRQHMPWPRVRMADEIERLWQAFNQMQPSPGPFRPQEFRSATADDNDR